MSKYQPLADYLSATPPDTVSLTFERLEREILRADIPPSARCDRKCWQNYAGPSGKAQSQAWQRVGWRVQAVDLDAETVSFARGVPDER